MAVRAQQRHSPRGANGDRNKASKGRDKKEAKEAKEGAGKTKDDKVPLFELSTQGFITSLPSCFLLPVLSVQLLMCRKAEQRIKMRVFLFQNKADVQEKEVKKFDGTGYDKDLVEALERDIISQNPNVRWYVFEFFFYRLQTGL